MLSVFDGTIKPNLGLEYLDLFPDEDAAASPCGASCLGSVSTPVYCGCRLKYTLSAGDGEELLPLVGEEVGDGVGGGREGEGTGVSEEV